MLLAEMIAQPMRRIVCGILTGAELAVVRRHSRG
jgi:hypothetical protein